MVKGMGTEDGHKLKFWSHHLLEMYFSGGNYFFMHKFLYFKNAGLNIIFKDKGVESLLASSRLCEDVILYIFYVSLFLLHL